MTAFRVLVTSSRDYTDKALIRRQLTALLAATVALGQRFTLVHGACRTGGDAHADEWGEDMRRAGHPVDIERHPATEDFGPWPARGPRRNRHMVSLGADVALAFIDPCVKASCRKPRPHGSHGATGCADFAAQAGIVVRRWPV